MKRRRWSWFSPLLVGLLVLAPEAEARFGKGSSSKGSKSKPGRTHAASPVGSSGSKPRSRPVRHASSSPRARGYVTSPRYASGSVAASAGEDPTGPRKNFVFGFDAQAVGKGGRGMALHLGLEVDRFGLMLRGGGLSLRAEEGRGEDSLGLWSAHLSYAVIAGERGRVRVESGLSVIRAPDATFLGPSFGGSAEYFLFDALSVEGRAHLTPVPHRQLDMAGGLAWYFFEDLFALRGGMRLLVLDDAGLVDGIVHRDLLAGPYLSLGLAL